MHNHSFTLNPFIYSTFGMVMPGRSYQSGIDYTYGYCGKENDEEFMVSAQNFGSRIHDGRLARWLSTDPEFKIYPSHSPYNSIGNSPIVFKDIDGEKVYIYYDTGKRDADNKPIISSYEYGSAIRMPNNRFVRQSVRTLNRIQRKEKDPNGIIKNLTNSETANAAIVKRDKWDQVSFNVQASGGTMRTEGGKEQQIDPSIVPDIISWNPKSGFVSLDGAVKQSAANDLLHELAHTYYEMMDPEGHIAEFNTALAKGPEAVDEYNKKEAEAVGDYDNYADKWIIENVESKFGEGKRTDHRGAMMKTIGGIFSKLGFKYAKVNGEHGKVKDLEKK